MIGADLIMKFFTSASVASMNILRGCATELAYSIHFCMLWIHCVYVLDSHQFSPDVYNCISKICAEPFSQMFGGNMRRKFNSLNNDFWSLLHSSALVE